MMMRTNICLVAAALAVLFFASGAAQAQQSVLMTGKGVADCNTGLPTPGVVDRPIELRTDLNGHPCVSAAITSGGVVGYDAGAAVSGSNGIQTGGVDTAGNFVRSPASIAMTVTAASATNKVLKASAGLLQDVSAWCSVACYLIVVDAASAPADGAVAPLMTPIPIAAGGSGFASFGDIAVPFTTGATAFISTTAPYTKTTPGAGTFYIGGRAR